METGREGLTATMLRAYRAPRAIMARLVPATTDGRALGWLFLACVLGFVASVPEALRKARGLGIDDPVAGSIAAHLFGYLFVAPLLAYALAAIAHLGARAAGGRAPFLRARVALFWALLLAAPLALALAAVRVIAEALGLGGGLAPLGWVAFAFWLWLFAAGFAEAEEIRATWRVAAASGLVFAAIAVALSMLTRGAPVAG